MLDKQTTKLVLYLAQTCEDGSFKVIETPDLSRAISKKADIDTIRPILKFLQDGEMLDVKYSDENKYCLSVLPKARVYVETLGVARQEIKLSRRFTRFVVIAAFVAAFAGAALAGAVIELLGRIF